MLPLLSIFGGLFRASRRELATFSGLKVNNFFLFVALMVWAAAYSGVEPKSAEFPILLLALLALFPMSSDPLALAPASRLALWPLAPRQRFGLQLMSLAVSPVAWMAAVILGATGRWRLAVLWMAMAAGVQLVKLAGRPLEFGLARSIPQFGGRLGGLIRSNLRDLLSVLDPYLAAVLSAGGAAYRMLAPSPEPEAAVILAVLVGLALSTCAQCLFGLDVNGSALTRYALMPVRGWQILLAKDVAFLALLIVLLLPLDLAAGLTFGLVALAVGHHSSVVLRTPIFRWRFAGSRLFPGVVQGVLALVMGLAAHRASLWFLAAAAALWTVSLLIYGRVLDGRLRVSPSMQR